MKRTFILYKYKKCRIQLLSYIKLVMSNEKQSCCSVYEFTLFKRQTRKLYEVKLANSTSSTKFYKNNELQTTMISNNRSIYARYIQTRVCISQCSLNSPLNSSATKVSQMYWSTNSSSWSIWSIEC